MVLLGSSISACKKDDETIPEAASFTIVNAIAGTTPLVTNFDNSKKLYFYQTAQQIAAYGFTKYSGYLGDYNLGIYRLADTTKTQYQINLKLEPNSIKTLYLSGTVAETEGMLIPEKIPVYKQADSLIGVRFINLSKGSGPVNVALRSAVSNIATALDYKGVSGFQVISARTKDPVSYVFDFKDASTGTVISSYTLSSLPSLLSKSVTVVLRGIRGGTGTSIPGTFLVNNY